ncbi:MAG: ribosomal protein S18-alanine N-acetyltransferase [Clostridia bacterium]|nr:ribosomal protein S18-alanine N-acetyltransferase [Clostridia bacterium]
MTFQFLQREDVDKIVELFNENFPDGWNKNMLLSAFDGGRFFSIGCFNNEKLIGAITCSLSIDDADIEGITVDKTYRNKGVGQKLLKNAEQNIKDSGITAVLLEVRQSNIPAKSLYEKAGYKQIFVRKSYYSDGENAVVMKKELQK